MVQLSLRSTLPILFLSHLVMVMNGMVIINPPSMNGNGAVASLPVTTNPFTARAPRIIWTSPLLNQLSTARSIFLPYRSLILPRATSLTTNVPADSTFPITSSSDTSVQSTLGPVGTNTVTSINDASMQAIAQGTELVADQIVTALGGMSAVMDLLRQLTANSNAAVGNNFGSSARIFADRLLTVGMNAAGTVLDRLGARLVTPGAPSTFSTIGENRDIYNPTITPTIQDINRTTVPNTTSSSTPLVYISDFILDLLNRQSNNDGLVRTTNAAISSISNDHSLPGTAQNLAATSLTSDNTNSSSNTLDSFVPKNELKNPSLANDLQSSIFDQASSATSTTANEFDVSNNVEPSNNPDATSDF